MRRACPRFALLAIDEVPVAAGTATGETMPAGTAQERRLHDCRQAAGFGCNACAPSFDPPWGARARVDPTFLSQPGGSLTMPSTPATLAVSRGKPGEERAIRAPLGNAPLCQYNTPGRDGARNRAITG